MTLDESIVSMVDSIYRFDGYTGEQLAEKMTRAAIEIDVVENAQ